MRLSPLAPSDGGGLISQSAFAVTKEGLGTLVLAPSAQCSYKSLVVADGRLAVARRVCNRRLARNGDCNMVLCV